MQAASVFLRFKNRSWQPCSTFVCYSKNISALGKPSSVSFLAFTVMKKIKKNALFLINYCISSVAYIPADTLRRLEKKSQTIIRVAEAAIKMSKRPRCVQRTQRNCNGV